MTLISINTSLYNLENMYKNYKYIAKLYKIENYLLSIKNMRLHAQLKNHHKYSEFGKHNVAQCASTDWTLCTNWLPEMMPDPVVSPGILQLAY